MNAYKLKVTTAVVSNITVENLQSGSAITYSYDQHQESMSITMAHEYESD
jgi:hypothetical protein